MTQLNFGDMLLAMVRVRETRVHVCDEDSGWNKILSKDKTEMYRSFCNVNSSEVPLVTVRIPGSSRCS